LICLGLNVSNEDVIFDIDVCGEVGLLFPYKEIKIKDIIERIRTLVIEDKHVDNVSVFVWFYVLLYFISLAPLGV